MNDDKVIHVLSRVFEEVVAKSNGRTLYEATDRHGLLEWAAQVFLPGPTGYDTVVNLALWDSSPDEIALSSSVARITTAGDKAVQDFVRRVALADGYDAITQAASQLLDSAIMFARQNPQPLVPVGAGPLFDFASPPEEAGARPRSPSGWLGPPFAPGPAPWGEFAAEAALPTEREWRR
jgi:hypothetical protein